MEDRAANSNGGEKRKPPSVLDLKDKNPYIHDNDDDGSIPEHRST